MTQNYTRTQKKNIEKPRRDTDGQNWRRLKWITFR